MTDGDGDQNVMEGKNVVVMERESRVEIHMCRSRLDRVAVELSDSDLDDDERNADQRRYTCEVVHRNRRCQAQAVSALSLNTHSAGSTNRYSNIRLMSDHVLF